MEGWQLGAGTRLLHVRSNGFRLTRTSKHLRMAAPERISLAIQLRGCCTLTQRDLTVVDRVGELELTDLTSPFDYVHRGEGAAEALYIDNDHLGLTVDVVRRAAPRVQGSPLYDLVRQHVHQLLHVAVGVEGSHTATMLGTATVELVRALIASAAEHNDVRSALAESLFTRITTYIGLHLSETDLGPTRIAAEHNISLRYLHTLFARQGLHVHEWIIRERLEAARRVLASTSAQEPTIAAVARTLGFSDPGHFARRFRAAYGLSPSEWQRIHRKLQYARTGHS
jgi:AraC-like DNA-binding protein